MPVFLPVIIRSVGERPLYRDNPRGCPLSPRIRAIVIRKSPLLQQQPHRKDSPRSCQHRIRIAFESDASYDLTSVLSIRRSSPRQVRPWSSRANDRELISYQFGKFFPESLRNRSLQYSAPRHIKSDRLRGYGSKCERLNGSAQSLQNVSSLDGGNDSKEQTELKESEMHLSLHTASQSSQLHLTQAHITSTKRPTTESGEGTVGSERPRNSQGPSRELPTETKERGNRRRYKERYPILCAFLAICAKTGAQADKVHIRKD